MKPQYLGDSKDCFKWDYLHFLVQELGYRQLQIAWMMTRDDNGPEGGTPPECFPVPEPAKQKIWNFCHCLKKNHDPKLLVKLAATTAARYTVSLYKPDEPLVNKKRGTYFSDLVYGPDQVLFLDPDNGFEPERSCTAKHVRYDEVEGILKRVSPASVVTVFQHNRRKKFPEDLARIRKRLCRHYCAAIYWRSLMFVTISTSKETIRRVREANCKYAKDRPPVKVLDQDPHQAVPSRYNIKSERGK